MNTPLVQVGPNVYIVPKNTFGIFEIHIAGHPRPTAEFVQAIIAGPITHAEPKLQEELRKPLFAPCMLN